VVGHDEVGLFADAKPGRRNVYAPGCKVIHLFKKDVRVEHNTIADEADFVFVQYAGRDKVEDGFLALYLDGVTSVVAALKADDNAALGAQHINNLALALVAPLGADDDRIRHGVTCLQCRRTTAGDVGCVMLRTRQNDRRDFTLRPHCFESGTQSH